MHRTLVWSLRACAALTFLFATTTLLCATSALCGRSDVAGPARMRRALMVFRNGGWSGHQRPTVLAPPAAPTRSSHPRRALLDADPAPNNVPWANVFYVLYFDANNTVVALSVDQKDYQLMKESAVCRANFWSMACQSALLRLPLFLSSQPVLSLQYVATNYTVVVRAVDWEDDDSVRNSTVCRMDSGSTLCLAAQSYSFQLKHGLSVCLYGRGTQQARFACKHTRRLKYRLDDVYHNFVHNITASPPPPSPPPLVPLASRMTYMALNKTEGYLIDKKHLTLFYEDTNECPRDIMEDLFASYAPQPDVCRKAFRLHQERIRYVEHCFVAIPDGNQKIMQKYACERSWQEIVCLEDYFYKLFV